MKKLTSGINEQDNVITTLRNTLMQHYKKKETLLENKYNTLCEINNKKLQSRKDTIEADLKELASKYEDIQEELISNGIKFEKCEEVWVARELKLMAEIEKLHENANSTAQRNLISHDLEILQKKVVHIGKRAFETDEERRGRILRERDLVMDRILERDKDIERATARKVDRILQRGRHTTLSERKFVEDNIDRSEEAPHRYTTHYEFPWS